MNDRTIDVKQDFTFGINLANAAHPCVTSPCANGGTCVPKKDSYECDCPLGFDGQHCQKGNNGWIPTHGSGADHKNKEDLAPTTAAVHMPLNRNPGGQSSPFICALSMYLGKNLFCYLGMW